MRNATAFRGEADKTASPCMVYYCTFLPNVPVERLERNFTLNAKEWQWLTPLLGNFFLAEISSFEAVASKFTF